jgi:hypothetical protein
MEDYVVKRLAWIYAIQAEIEGMKAKNKERESEGMSLAYSQEHFENMAYELRAVAAKHEYEF